MTSYHRYAIKTFIKGIVEEVLINGGVDGFIANSTLTKELLLKAFPKIDSTKIRVSWPSIPKQFINAETSVNNNIISTNKYENIAICSFLHIDYLDGADLLPKIFLVIKNEFRDLKMHVIGSIYNEYVKTLLLKFAKLNKDFNVYFGYYPYEFIKTVLRQCIILVYPARLKFFGVPVLEAMYEGLIPIVTDMTGAKDFVRIIDESLIVKLDNSLVNNIANKIINLIVENKDEIVYKMTTARRLAWKWFLISKGWFLRQLLHIIVYG